MRFPLDSIVKLSLSRQHACDGIAEYHLYVARVHFEQIIFTLNRQLRVSFTDDRLPPLNTQFWLLYRTTSRYRL